MNIIVIFCILKLNKLKSSFKRLLIENEKLVCGKKWYRTLIVHSKNG